MRVAILAVGDELALGQKLDTNSRWIASAMARAGASSMEHRTVGDDVNDIAAAIGELAAGASVLVVTGGLGPTDDDLTRFALGAVTDPGAPLVEDPSALRRLHAWFRGRGRPMPERNHVQVMHPRSCRLLDNPNGTAPGIAGTVGSCRVFVLPGPPREMMPMFRADVLPVLEVSAPGAGLLLRTVHAACLSEAVAADRLGPLLHRDRAPRIGITVSQGIVTATARLQRCAAAEESLDADEQAILEAWAPYAFGTGSTTLAMAVGASLSEHADTLATAESCTGGWLGRCIVDVGGSSAYYLGGWVTYADAMKQSCLGVEPELLERHGAVSEPVAVAMARGAVQRSDATRGVSITGIAGPDGGSPDKPVGTVYIGLARRTGAEISSIARRFRFRGDRDDVRGRSVVTALQMLRLHLLGAEDAELLFEAPGACR